MQIPKITQEILNHKGIFYLQDSGLFLTQRPQLSFEKNFRSREVHLKDLGRFPLDEKNRNLLEHVYEHDGKKLMVPEILKKSQIPIFYTEGPNLPVYIPPVAFPILQYFSALWEKGQEGIESILSGFIILDSFVGGSA